MKRYTSGILLVLPILVFSAQHVLAAKKTPPPKKPTSTHHETVGTEQLKGEYGLIGHTYTLGKLEPWNVKLKSAEYTVDIVRTGDKIISPDREKKVLLLHFTVHNAQKGLGIMRFDTIRFTAVDANDKNWESNGNISSEETKAKIDQRFKPAQKMDIYTAILVPAAGEIPKLILTSKDNRVIRYDLREKVKPLPEPFADPNDKTSATALSVVPAKLGVAYPVSQYNVSVDGISFSDGPVDGKTAGNGGRFLIANISAKYMNTFGSTLRFDSFIFKGVDADGLDIAPGKTLLAPSSDTQVNMKVEPGQEVRFRVYFKINKGVVPQSIVVTGQQIGRSYKYAVE